MKHENEHVNGHADTLSPRSTEVIAKPGRRRFTAAYIDAVLKELDAARHGEIGKILRREGLYAKQVAMWRKQRTTGIQPKRGPKPTASTEVRKELARQEREIARLRRKLDQAEMIIDVQKKVATLLSTMDESDELP
jgi:transposase-like protein